MIRCLIVDDEKLALELMEDNVLKVPFLQLVGKCKNVTEAIEVMSREQIDLMFLDIQMPGISGMQFLHSLTNPPMVIICSAYDNYAIDGFNKDVVDYLLKPVAFERFLKAANKASDLYNLRQQNNNTKQAGPDYLFVNADYSVVRINIPDIVYVEGLKDYIKIYVKDQPKAIITRLSMRFMEEKLPADGFARVHKSYIVALDKISSFKRNRLMLGDIEVPVSDNYKDKVLNYIGLSDNNASNNI